MFQHANRWSSRYLKYLAVAVPVVLCHNLIHEAMHYIAAVACGEPVEALHFLTNGWGTSQVVFGTPVDQRAGAHWLVIAWTPSVVTTFLGYGLYALRGLGTAKPTLRRAWLYAGFFFLLLDPFYMSVLSVVVGGDTEAAAAVGMAHWPVVTVAAVVLIANSLLYVRWQRNSTARMKTQASWGSQPNSA